MPITQRGRKFQVTIYHNGERLPRRTFETRADAEAWELDVKRKLAQGIPLDLGEAKSAVSRQVITLTQLRDETLKYHWQGSKGYATAEKNSSSVCETLGWTLPVSGVTTRRVEDMCVKLAEKGNTDGTINRKLSALSTMLKYALKHDYIQKLPEMQRRKEPENRIRWLSDDEEAEALAYFEYVDNEDMTDFVTLAVDTGFRRSELLKLQARDVAEGKVYIWESKGRKARAVPLTRRAAAVLGKRLNRVEKHTDKLFKGWTKDMIRYHWDRARLHMGLMSDPQMGIHVLRHTFCSRLAQRGVPMAAIKELAGHASIVTTQRYVHMSPDNLRDAISVLDSNTRLQSTSPPLPSNGGETVVEARNGRGSGLQDTFGINNLETLSS